MTYVQPSQFCSWCDKKNTKIQEPGVELTMAPDHFPESMSTISKRWPETWDCRRCGKRNKLVREFRRR